MKPVVVLGIDGLDWSYVDRHLDDLPQLGRLAATGTLAPLASTFPPDSIPAWTTIFTGLAPADHGVLDSIDYFDRHPDEAVAGASAFLRGRTFWDKASTAGCTVCVINAFMAYPAWPVRGVMVSGPVFIDEAEPSIYPNDAVPRHELPQLGGIVGFPTEREMPEFVASTMSDTKAQAALGLRLLEREHPDLFFLNILTIDRLQHFAWRFTDVTDPTYPGPTPLASAVRDAYRAVDSIVSEFSAAVGECGTLVVLSDHGHGLRAHRMLCVDEVMRRAGLVATGSVAARARALILETTKRCVFAASKRLGADELLYSVARRLPGRKQLKTASYALAEASLVRPSRKFGRGGSGGVDVAAVGLVGEELVRRVIDALSAVRDDDGSRVVAWARRREEVVTGDHADAFPAVLFQLEPGYGIDFGVYGPLLRPDPLHRRVSGGHRPLGVLAGRCGTVPLPSPPASVLGIHDMVLQLLATA